MAEALANRGMVDDLPVDFRIGECLVQPEVNRLVVDGAETPIEPKAMDVLLCLASEPGRVISRQELLERAWDGSFVTDDALTQAIVQLRRVLKDSAEEPRYIETIRKKGYRLVAEVSPIPGLMPVEAPAEPTNRAGRWSLIAAIGSLLTLVALAIGGLAPSRGPDVGDGLEAVPLTTWPGIEGYASPSPDGSRVVFAAARPGSSRYDLFMKQPGSDTTIQLTHRPGHTVSPTWSPDGRYIAFARRGPDRCEVLQIAALGGPETLLRPCGSGSVPLMHWSPDGRSLVISTWGERQGPYRLELFDFESRTTRILTDPPAGYNGDRFPEFHPDGRSVVFRRTRTQAVDHLFRLYLETGELEQITSEPGSFRGATWTPNGKGLVVGRQHLGTFELAWMSANGKQIRRLPLGTQAYFPLFGASGLLGYLTREDRSNFWQLDLEGDAGWSGLAHSSRTDWSPMFSPDGERIAFGSDRNGAPGIWVGDRAGEQLEELLTFGGPHMTHPNWSPDGRSLVFEARTGGASQIYRLLLGSEAAERLTDSDSLNTTPSFSRDGRYVYFGSDRTGAFEVWRVDLESEPRALEQVTTGGGYMARESEDGTWLYYSTRKPGGLSRMPVSGGPGQQVLPAQSDPLAEGWALSDEGVYFIRNTPRELFYFDLGTAELLSLGEVSAGRYGSIALDPRGERLIVQFREWIGADIYTTQWPAR